MKFSIVFENSGDEIKYTALDSNMYELLEFYVESLETVNANSFSSNDQVLLDGVRDIDETIRNVNGFMYPLLEDNIPVCDNEEDYLEQHFLSKLHESWVHSQSKVIDIQYVVNKYADRYPFVLDIPRYFSANKQHLCSIVSALGYDKNYNKINHDVHVIEKFFRRMAPFKATNHEWVQFDNPFRKSWSSLDRSHFALQFHHLGRSQYNMFQTFDTDKHFTDENTFNELLGIVDLSLTQAETHPYSKEYLDYCKANNVEPSGARYAIGNIDDILERLTDYRKIYYKSLKNNDAFKIVLE